MRAIARSRSGLTWLAFALSMPCGFGQVCPDLDYGSATVEQLGSDPWCSVGGDFDGDGADDLFVGRSPLFGEGSLHLLMSDGAGNFSAPQIIGPVHSPRALAVGDVDGDGDLDLVVADRGVGSNLHTEDGLRIFQNQGSGTFAALPLVTFGPADDEPEALALGDLDGDGDLDAVVTLHLHQQHAKVRSYLNDGSGGFTHHGVYPTSPTQAYPMSLALADLSGDGHLDYAVVNVGDNSYTVVHGNGDGTFGPVGTTYSAGLYPWGITAGDFDEDGDVDLAISYKYGILRADNDGTGAFPTGSTPFVQYYPKTIRSVDFDQDGHMDLVATFANSSSLNFLRGSGSGTFTSVRSMVAGSAPYAVALGDWNGDGVVDPAVANNTSTVVRIWNSNCAPSRYCMGKVDSIGCVPGIESSGVPRLSGTDPFLVNASLVLNQQPGLLVYSHLSAATPFQGGVLCLAPPLLRTNVQTSGGTPTGHDCTGTFSFDFGLLLTNGSIPGLVPGDTLYAQYWSRDPFDLAGFDSSLSDALEFSVLP